MPPSLQVAPLRLDFRAVDVVRIPPGKAGNVFRGGFGTILRQLACDPDCAGTAQCPRRGECAYAALFEPRRREGPSGFANPPRPFVIRAASLDGRVIRPGESFSADVHVFGDPFPGAAEWMRRVFADLARFGLGAGRGRAELVAVECRETVLLSIDDAPVGVDRLAIEFVTPTDLKAEGADHAAPEFYAVFARARDRVATLMALYGTGAPDADYHALGASARSVQTVSTDLRRVNAERRSSRTGQSHDIGGFVGRAEYEGNLAPFLPWLRAAYWTGIGRHTVWGNGVIRATD